jgi:hypothetical protein
MSADELYGPITTVRTNGKIVKKIPWSAFQLGDDDWKRVKYLRNILEVCHLKLFNFLLIIRDRTRIKYNNTSRQNDYQRFGVRSLRLRSCKLFGKRNSTHSIISTITLQSPMD